MGRSIRWTLIGWFGLLLLGVVVAYGVVLHDASARATWAGVDETLGGHARAILGALEYDAEYLGPPPPDAEPKVLGSGWELALSVEFRRGLAQDGYWAVYGADGVPIHAEGVGMQAGAPAMPGGVGPGGVIRTPGAFRELWLAGAPDGRVVTALVGRPVTAERAHLSALARTVTVTGLGLLALALAGGAWLARRSVAPIGRMAGTAAALRPDDLSARLDEAGVPSELRGLAAAFNTALGRLEATFARERRFTADASHELRTPVAVLRAQAESALRQERTPAAYRAALEACARAAERMTGTLEGLLALARAEGGGPGPGAVPVPLAPVVREAAAALAPAAAAAQVTVRCTAGDADVRGDPVLLGQVVTNLVANAIRYNRPGGTVDVGLHRADGHVELRVADTGIGIPADALPRLFEPFFRADPARSRASGGSGLGLALAKRIVDAHGGTVAVQSREGAGTTFTVTLPVAAESPDA